MTEPSTIRRKRLIWAAGAAVTIAVVWGGSILLSDPDSRETDDAYIGGHVVQITPQTTGTVSRVLADNTDVVAPGAPLVELDGADAGLAQAVRNVRGLFAGDARFAADVDVKRSELARAQAALAARHAIAGSGAVTGEDVRHAADAVRTAQAALGSAGKAREEALTRTAGVTLAANPAVRIAAERVRAAALAVERITICAPVGGMVAQRSVQLGRRVNAGDRLMAVVPLDRLWIDANFKEG